MDISFHYPPVPACSHEDGTENLIPGLSLPVPTHGKDPSSVCCCCPSLLVMIKGRTHHIIPLLPASGVLGGAVITRNSYPLLPEEKSMSAT